jgi:hypothetical protein
MESLQKCRLQCGLCDWTARRKAIHEDIFQSLLSTHDFETFYARAQGYPKDDCEEEILGPSGEEEMETAIPWSG